MKKHSVRNNIQRYKCNFYHKIFTYQQKLNPADTWFGYSQGKQTYRSLAIKYQCQRELLKNILKKNLLKQN
ncbi:hypothetical protein [Nicoletella semolina]|uniref:hypothetical protein n=1 Tax=Nicoletella semolina TaxID=271160 RepID=UPI003C7C3E5E